MTSIHSTRLPRHVSAMRHCLLPLPLALGLAWPFGTIAQTAPPRPDIGDALRQVSPPLPVEPRPPAIPAIEGAPAEPPMQRLPGGEASVQVDSFDIAGNRVIDKDTLAGLLQPETGRRLSLAELEAAAARITRYYRQLGYFVARAYVPAQEVTQGRLTIRVVEGNYGRFVLDNRSLVKDEVVQGLLDDVKDRDIVSLDTLERAMLIINDTPGVKLTRADVMPGEKVGTSDFSIGAEAGPAVDGYAMLDNAGSAYTGKTRLSFSTDWNSPTARGDRLSLSGMVTDRHGLLNGRLAYSGLLASNGLRGELAAGRTQYQLGGSYGPLDASGTADALELGVTYPLKRTRQHSIQLGVSGALRALKDEVAATSTMTRKRSASLAATLSTRMEHELAGFDGLTEAAVSFTAGRLRFADDTSRALDAAGARTEGTYTKLDLQLSRATALSSRWSLNVSGKVQLALGGKNLDGSERMGVTGLGGVAAYPIGELSGDEAALVRAELSRAMPAMGALAWTASGFIDAGTARAARPVAGQPGQRTLSDYGLGLTATAGHSMMRLQLAHRLGGGSPTSEPVARTRALLQVGWIF